VGSRAPVRGNRGADVSDHDGATHDDGRTYYEGHPDVPPLSRRVWAVARGDHPGSHYVAPASALGPTVQTGLTLDEAMAHMRALTRAAGGGPGAEVKGGGTG